MSYMIPNDPNMLLSFMNMMLRGRYSSLEEFCVVNNADINDIKEKLNAIGYDYNEEMNQFK